MTFNCPICKKQIIPTKRQKGHLRRGNQLTCGKKKCINKINNDRRIKKREIIIQPCGICGKKVKLNGHQIGHYHRGHNIQCESNVCKMLARTKTSQIRSNTQKPKTTRYFEYKARKARQEAALNCPKYYDCINRASKNGNQMTCHECNEPRIDKIWMKTAELKNRNAPEEYPVHLPIAIV